MFIKNSSILVYIIHDILYSIRLPHDTFVSKNHMKVTPKIFIIDIWVSVGAHKNTEYNMIIIHESYILNSPHIERTKTQSICVYIETLLSLHKYLQLYHNLSIKADSVSVCLEVQRLQHFTYCFSSGNLSFAGANSSFWTFYDCPAVCELSHA